MKYSDLVDDEEEEEEEANVVRREIINDPRSLPSHSERYDLLAPFNDHEDSEYQKITKRESPGTSLVSEETELPTKIVYTSKDVKSLCIKYLS